MRSVFMFIATACVLFLISKIIVFFLNPLPAEWALRAILLVNGEPLGRERVNNVKNVPINKGLQNDRQRWSLNN